MSDADDGIVEFNDDGQPHYMLTVIDMAVKGYLSPERAKTPRLAGERMLVNRCLDSYFGHTFRHVDLDRLIPMSYRSRDEVLGAMPALLWALLHYSRWHTERAPTHILLDGQHLTMEDAAKRWPPLQD